MDKKHKIRCMSVTFIVTILMLPFLLPGQVRAKPKDNIMPGPIPAEVIRVIDGDTLLVRARIWPGQTVETKVRLDGINTPEKRGKCAAEKKLAAEATAFMERFVTTPPITLHNVRFGKYAGRVVAGVRNGEGIDAAEALLAANYGHIYSGGKRRGWCD